MVLTSHEKMGETGRKTGVWLDEFVAPYYVFAISGAEITIASPRGGKIPVDPESLKEEVQTEDTKRYQSDTDLQKKLNSSKELSKINPDDYDGLFYPGGHGPLWDLANNLNSIAIIEDFISDNKPMAFVCHAPGVLGNVEDHNAPFLRGKEVTGFTNSEEESVGLQDIVPFLVEDKMNQVGANFNAAPNGEENVVIDGKLITGQNPASSKKAAQELVRMLQK